MYGKMKQHLRAELDSLGEAGLYKRERAPTTIWGFRTIPV